MLEIPDPDQPNKAQQDSLFSSFLKKFSGKKSIQPATTTRTDQKLTEKLKQSTSEEKIRREIEKQETVRRELFQQITWPTTLPDSLFEEVPETNNMVYMGELVSDAILQQAKKESIETDIPSFPFLDTAYGGYQVEAEIQHELTPQRYDQSYKGPFEPKPSRRLIMAIAQTLQVPSEVLDASQLEDDHHINMRMSRLTQGNESAKSIVASAIQSELSACAQYREDLIHQDVEFPEDPQATIQSLANRTSLSFGVAKMYTELYKKMRNPVIEQSVTTALTTAANKPHSGLKS